MYHIWGCSVKIGQNPWYFNAVPPLFGGWYNGGTDELNVSALNTGFFKGLMSMYHPLYHVVPPLYHPPPIPPVAEAGRGARPRKEFTFRN